MKDSTVVRPNDLGFDPEILHRKYAEERSKRVRPDGNAQYVPLAGEFAEYADDPYAEPGFTRAPLTDDVDVVVLGGGITGLMTAARLREAGIKDVRIIDKAGDFGGTWYWNRYPGIRCDTESYIYMQILEELGTIPTEKYATGAEILAHCQAIGRHYHLYEKACFQTQVTAITWDDAISRWIIKTDRDDRMRARFLCTGTGVLSKPKLPGIPGIRDYKGHSFHTSRWDYAYTGGDANGNLTGLRDKRVAIIGTGATSVQIIPHLGASAKELIVFQRTPSSIDIRNNRPTDPEWAKSLRPGWHKRRMENFTSILIGVPQDEDLIGDRWTHMTRIIAELAKAGTDPAELVQLADYVKMEGIRARVDEVVADRKTAEALKPWYNLWCKRPLFSDDYLPTFNRSNVKLVDTQGRGVDRIVENGLEYDGLLYEVDCIIYASGFDLGAATYDAGNYRLTGRDGADLSKKWAKGVKSLHGVYTRGFPNFFVLGGITQAAVTTNFPHILGEQAAHVAAVIKRCFDDQVRTMEVSEAAEAAWARTMAEKPVNLHAFEAACTPGDFNKSGKTDVGPTLFGGTYGGGPFEYLKICQEWRVSGFPNDMELTFR